MTIGILAVALAGLIGWDLYVATNMVKGDTISEVVLGWSRKVWTLPLIVGIACGHLFWPLPRPRPIWVAIGVLAGCGIVAIVLDIVGHPPVMPAIPFAIGGTIGHFIWGQRA
jgi:hypothetical protein